MCDKILMSIIIPVYNTQKHLRKCLDSIIDKNINNYEIILVDDGSNDDSPKICDEYKNTYDFIKVVHKINGGLASARNAGLEIAEGDYVLLLIRMILSPKNIFICLKKALKIATILLYFRILSITQNKAIQPSVNCLICKTFHRQKPFLYWTNWELSMLFGIKSIKLIC